MTIFIIKGRGYFVKAGKFNSLRKRYTTNKILITALVAVSTIEMFFNDVKVSSVTEQHF